MKPLKILGLLAKIAAPVVAGIVAGPAAGATVAGALGVGVATKAAGKKFEKETGLRLHKVVTPAAVVGLPAVTIAAFAPGFVQQLCDLVAQFCQHDLAVAVIPGLFAWLAHVIGSGIEKTAGK